MGKKSKKDKKDKDESEGEVEKTNADDNEDEEENKRKAKKKKKSKDKDKDDSEGEVEKTNADDNEDDEENKRKAKKKKKSKDKDREETVDSGIEDKSEETDKKNKDKTHKEKKGDENGKDDKESLDSGRQSKSKKKKKKKDKDISENEDSDSGHAKENRKKSPKEETKSEKRKKKKEKDDSDEESDDSSSKRKSKHKSKPKVEDSDDGDSGDEPPKRKSKKKKNTPQPEESDEDDSEDERSKRKKKKKKKSKRDESEDESEDEDIKRKSKKKSKSKIVDSEEDESEDESTRRKRRKKNKRRRYYDDSDTGDESVFRRSTGKSKGSRISSTTSSKSSESKRKFPVEIFEESQLFIVLADINEDTLKKVVGLVGGETPKVNVNNKGSYNETYLHVLASPRSDAEVSLIIPIIYALAAAGIDINAQDREGNTALHICSLNDVHHTIANTLIKLGMDPCLLNSDEQDALDLAENEKMKSVLGYFDPGMWRAVEEKDEDQVKVLVDAWCKVDIEKDGMPLTELAELNRNQFIVEYIATNRNTIRMCHVAMSGDSTALQAILDDTEKCDVDVKDWSFLRDDGERTPWPLLAELIRLGLFDCAKVLLKHADVNVMIEPKKHSRLPLFLWAIRYIRNPDTDFLIQLLSSADMTLVDNPMELMYEAWAKKMPSEIVEIFVKQNISFTQRNHKGWTLRDRIFLETYQGNMDVLKESLFWVDQHIINMAKNGELEKLKKMVLDGYEYVNVSNLKGKTIYQVAKKAKQKETAKWLKQLPHITKNIIDLHNAIEKANLQDTKRFLDEFDDMDQARDKGGRSPLHKAVIFERRFIIRHLLRNYPHSVHYKDYLERTPLHLACALDDGGDIEDMLLNTGADETAKDYQGKTPMDYKMSNPGDFIHIERTKEYGTDVYLLDRYLAFVSAIENNEEEETMDEIRDCMSGIPLDDFNAKLPGKFKGMPYRPLLFVAVDKKSDTLARWLIRNGCDYNIATRFPDERGVKKPMSLLDAASSRKMYSLVDFIKRKIATSHDDSRAQAALDNALMQVDGADMRQSRARMSTGMSGHSYDSYGGSRASGNYSNQHINGGGGYPNGHPQKAWMKAAHQVNPQIPANQPNQKSGACVVM